MNRLQITTYIPILCCFWQILKRNLPLTQNIWHGAVHFFCEELCVFGLLTPHRWLPNLLMDLPEFSAISDDSQSLSDWTVLSASPKALPKALPLPSCLSRSVRPRIASPFQVTQLASSSSAIVRPSGPVVSLQLPGLPVPQPNSIDRGSESFPAHTGVHLLNRDCGLAAPFFSQPTPQSLQLDSGDSQSFACDVKIVPEGLQCLSKRGLNSAPTPKPSSVTIVLSSQRLDSSESFIHISSGMEVMDPSRFGFARYIFHPS